MEAKMAQAKAKLFVLGLFWGTELWSTAIFVEEDDTVCW